jgi:hypothetical protein
LLILIFELGKIAIFAMVLFQVRTIRLIFMIIPLMIVIVTFVVVLASVPLIGLLIVGSQRRWSHRDWDCKGGAQQGRIPETGHDYLLPVDVAIVTPNIRRRLRRTQRTEYTDDRARRMVLSPLAIKSSNSSDDVTCSATMHILPSDGFEQRL